MSLLSQMFSQYTKVKEDSKSGGNMVTSISVILIGCHWGINARLPLPWEEPKVWGGGNIHEDVLPMFLPDGPDRGMRFAPWNGEATPTHHEALEICGMPGNYEVPLCWLCTQQPPLSPWHHSSRPMLPGTTPSYGFFRAILFPAWKGDSMGQIQR